MKNIREAADYIIGILVVRKAKFPFDFSYKEFKDYLLVELTELEKEARNEALDEAIKVARYFEPDQRSKGVEYPSDAIFKLKQGGDE